MRIILLLSVVLGTGTGEDIEVGFVVNGTKALKGEYPFVARLTEGEAHLCLANIISPKWLLTVASCGMRIDLDTKVTVGSISKKESGTDYKIKTWIVHEDFNYTSFKNDIALIMVVGPIIFDESIQPVKLDYPQVDEIAMTAGWGYTQNLSKVVEDHLTAVKLNVISKKTCTDARRFKLQLEHCCAARDGRGPCSGDDGGCLLSEKGLLLAMLSYAPQPCATAAPNIYTIPAFYLCWIQEKTNIPAIYFLNY